MAIAPRVFLSHPKTSELYALKDAARIIGVSKATLYQRIRMGDTGERLWRPNELESTLPKESRQIIQDRSALLAKIPELTKFDKL